MIKKQLGVLAGSIMMAAGASAALVGGSADDQVSSTLVLALINDTNGTFLFDTGHTVEDLASGIGFSVDISAAAAVGATKYALFGIVGGAYLGYSYGNGYLETGGVIYAGDAPAPLEPTSGGMILLTSILSTYIDNANEGFNADGTIGDFGTTSNGTDTLFGDLSIAIGTVADIYLHSGTATFNAPTQTQISISGPNGTLDGAGIDGSNFVVTVSAVPVPAAAWLFGSALLGLGVVRRKS